MKKIILFFFVLCFVNSVNAEEQINLFNTDVFVNKDASIDVIETINVHAEGNKIQHGLVRRLPTHYTDSYNLGRDTDYQIQKVLLNNTPSPYHTSEENNQLNIYIGDKNTWLTPNNYTYTILYHVNDAINFLRDNDEIYWNMTGNNWDFPILKATATIHLPEDAVISNSAAYTGAKGSKDQNFVIDYPAKNQMTVTTTKVLSPREGLTVAAAFQKGIVVQLTTWEKIKRDFNWSNKIACLLAILLFFFYYCTWYKHGRDLRKKSIIPLFEPTKNLPPEAMRYIIRMGYDLKTFTAAIVNMAASGFLKIENNDSEFTLRKNKSTITLPAEEAQIANILFGGRDFVVLKQSNHEKITDAQKKFKSVLNETYKNKYFITNTSYFIIGIAITVLAIAAAIQGSRNPGNATFFIIWISGWTVACYFLFCQARTTIQQAFIFKSISTIFKALFSSLFLIPFLIGEAVALFAIAGIISIISIPFILLMLLLNFIFYRLLKAPTPEGRAVMDEIDGFKLFLSTTERFRLKEFNPPEKTPELFEKYLPYAIALDVENEWGQQFEEILKHAGIDPSQYRPTWYAGSAPWSSSQMAALPAILGAGIGSALAATTTSSSASGGGGSSGGGGGGGGGGGW